MDWIAPNWHESFIQFSYFDSVWATVQFILLVHNVNPVRCSSPTRLWLLWCCTQRAQALPGTLFYCPGWYRAFQGLRHTPSWQRPACCLLLRDTVDCGTEVAELPRICLLGFDAWEYYNCSERKKANIEIAGTRSEPGYNWVYRQICIDIFPWVVKNKCLLATSAVIFVNVMTRFIIS